MTIDRKTMEAALKLYEAADNLALAESIIKENRLANILMGVSPNGHTVIQVASNAEENVQIDFSDLSQEISSGFASAMLSAASNFILGSLEEKGYDVSDYVDTTRVWKHIGTEVKTEPEPQKEPEQKVDTPKKAEAPKQERAPHKSTTSVGDALREAQKNDDKDREVKAAAHYGPQGAATSKLIIDFRRKHNLTQDNLADMLGVSGASVSLWEKGATPAPDNLKRINKLMKEGIDARNGKPPSSHS